MKKSTYFIGFLTLATFVLILLTLHDMQTAQGIGYYLFLLGNHGSRALFDVIVDVSGIVLLALFLFLPCLFLGRLNVKSFFRLLAAYLALLPGVDLGKLVHVPDPPGAFALRQTFLEGDFLLAFLLGMKELSPVLRLWLPILCLLLMGNRILESTILKKWAIKCLGLQIPLLLGIFLFPTLSPFLSFAMQYLFLIICFDIWEDWYAARKNMKPWDIALFGGLWLRGIYLMIEVMSAWKA